MSHLGGTRRAPRAKAESRHEGEGNWKSGEASSAVKGRLYLVCNVYVS